MNNEMISLTFLTQFGRHQVEVPRNATLQQAIEDLKLDLKYPFDVYDATGSIISNSNAAAHRDSTIYVLITRILGCGCQQKSCPNSGAKNKTNHGVLNLIKKNTLRNYIS